MGQGAGPEEHLRQKQFQSKGQGEVSAADAGDGVEARK